MTQPVRKTSSVSRAGSPAAAVSGDVGAAAGGGSLPSPRELAAELRALAVSLGFDLVGIAAARTSPHADYLRGWAAAGKAGEMDYLSQTMEDRIDPQRLLPGARSIICVAMNYNPGGAGGGGEAAGAVDKEMLPGEEAPAGGEARCQGEVARYAQGDDYHEVMKKGLHRLADEIRGRYAGAKTKCGVDISAILEREAAAAGGIGWIGKNTCLINRQLGSWLVLGEVITTLELEADAAETDHCAGCRRCLDACPTGALEAPYQMDARRCISYLTLETRRPLQGEERRSIGGWIAGCDICQEVCPWNGRSPVSRHAAFAPRHAQLDAQQVLAWDEARYRQETRKSALRRMKLAILKDRARAVVENGGAGDAQARASSPES